MLSSNIHLKSMMKTKKKLISLKSLIFHISFPYIKKENRHDKLNARPISILSTLCKTFTTKFTKMLIASPRECGKIRTRKTWNTDTFHAEHIIKIANRFSQML